MPTFTATTINLVEIFKTSIARTGQFNQLTIGFFHCVDQYMYTLR